MMSLALPGARGTTTVTLRAGQSCADVLSANGTMTSATMAAANRIRCRNVIVAPLASWYLRKSCNIAEHEVAQCRIGDWSPEKLTRSEPRSNILAIGSRAPTWPTSDLGHSVY